MSTDSYEVDSYHGIQELDCGNDECEACYEVPTHEEYSHKTVTWVAEWICKECGEENSRDGWYDPNNNN